MVLVLIRLFTMPLVYTSRCLLMPLPLEQVEQGSGGGLLSRLRRGLSRTRQALGGRMEEVFAGKTRIDEELLEELALQAAKAAIQLEVRRYEIAFTTSNFYESVANQAIVGLPLGDEAKGLQIAGQHPAGAELIFKHLVA